VFQEVAVRGTGAGTAIPPLPPRAASCPLIGNSVISTSPFLSNAPSTRGSTEPTTRKSSEPSTIASSSQPPSASPSNVPSGVPSFSVRPPRSTEPTLSLKPTTRNSSEPSHILSSSRRPPFSSQPSFIGEPSASQSSVPSETPSTATRFDDDDNYEDDDDNFDDDDEEDYYVDDDEEDDDDEFDDDDDDYASNYGTTNYAGISALDQAKQTIAEKEQAIEQQIASSSPGQLNGFKDPNTGVVVGPSSMSQEVKYAAIGGSIAAVLMLLLGCLVYKFCCRKTPTKHVAYEEHNLKDPTINGEDDIHQDGFHDEPAASLGLGHGFTDQVPEPRGMHNVL